MENHVAEQIAHGQYRPPITHTVSPMDSAEPIDSLEMDAVEAVGRLVAVVQAEHRPALALDALAYLFGVGDGLTLAMIGKRHSITKQGVRCLVARLRSEFGARKCRAMNVTT